MNLQFYKRLNHIFSCVTAVIVLTISVTFCFAQSDQARIAGTVVDAKGAVP